MTTPINLSAYPATKIVRDSAGNLFRVLAADDPNLPQAYIGYPVKRVKGGFAAKAGVGGSRLVRKLGCTVVAEGA